MTTYTVLTFTAIERPVGDAEVSALLDTFEPSTVTMHNATTRPDGSTAAAYVSASWDDERWSIHGLQAALPDLSERLACEVEMVEEWDTRDADEQGSQGWRYRRGALVATGSTVFVWTDTAPALDTAAEDARDLMAERAADYNDDGHLS